ncbi:hypothetical protein [Streptomyces acidiscabies]|uniref:Uncharacterized protein n=1 Tax=Streptomyces acidiscabies TaxID=42234 RepID=A0AAP6EKR7_9ACTN|nr:hypothetical protein [Streptomyces acidiscabies]MBZ3913985.1 hypothetical protein [Streptomyces acidiscabies]MDX2965856.1 hypothetical protein [Streptomyces acidiscabies]MDX3025316.1 hypothetical protein [Streptomyces acidiscabies]MDX3795692.1 hypothetical protein [Streptomyces acidiscabies]
MRGLGLLRGGAPLCLQVAGGEVADLVVEAAGGGFEVVGVAGCDGSRVLEGRPVPRREPPREAVSVRRESA